MSSNTQDIIFEGAVGQYRRVELESWGDTGNLVPFDSDLKSLGFRFVGDLLCSALAQSILRAYVHPTEHTRGLLLVGVKEGRLNVFGLFLDSRFINGAVATTTTSRAVKDIPEKGVYRKICSWKGVRDLHSQHQTHLEALRKVNGDTLSLGDTLESVAESLDAFTVRMSS
jgi:hypothetical protein